LQACFSHYPLFTLFNAELQAGKL